MHAYGCVRERFAGPDPKFTEVKGKTFLFARALRQVHSVHKSKVVVRLSTSMKLTIYELITIDWGAVVGQLRFLATEAEVLTQALI